MPEYFTLQHAEAVPPFDLGKPTGEVFYLPFMLYTSNPVPQLKFEQYLMPQQNHHLVNR